MTRDYHSSQPKFLGQLSTRCPDWIAPCSMFRLFSDEFDTQVEIYDAEGRLVAFNDDDATSTNSRLEIDLGIDGQSTSYRIVVKSSSEQPGSGSYQLRMMFNRTTW